MIVHCDQCNTNFRLDDAKVKDTGVKVRCSKCRHIFVVFPEMPKEDSEFHDLLKSFGPASGTAMASAKEEEAPLQETSQTEDFSFTAGESGFAGYGDLQEEAGPPELAGEEASDTPDAGFSAGGGELQRNEFDFSALLDEPPPRVEESAQNEFQGLDVFDNLDFSSEEPVADGAVQGKTSSPQDAVFDDDFPLPETLPSDSRVEPVEESPEVALSDGDAAPPAPDFAVAFADEQPREEQGVQEEAIPEEGALIAQEVAADELPSLSSRRRQHSVLPIVVTAISVVFILLLAAGGLIFLKDGPNAFDRLGLGFLSQWAGMEVKEEGNISVRGMTGVFMANKEAGEIFVVTGEAVNGFKKPRASIQVRGFLYGPNGEVLMRKVAYCGNMLTQEQLKTLPLSKIELAMNNQFGDSLSNLGVPPGKGIPFVIVFTKLPNNAVDYGVEVAGSTVAGK